MAIATEIHPRRITGAAQRLETGKPLVPVTYGTRHMADWSRQRWVILLRRQLKRPLAIVDHGDPAQPRLGFRN
jgi:hypothetical protein